jgi:hypothetical protein
MNLVMFDKFCPNLKTRAQLEERRFDMNKYDRNHEIYVVTMIPLCSTKRVGDHLRERED